MEAGERIDERFVIERRAGAGGMGAVYRALDLTTGEPVAIKLLEGAAPGSRAAARFAREAAVLAELRHPGVVRYVAHGAPPGGRPYLAMEWLEGEDLAARLARTGALGVGESVRLIARAADALAAAHARGVVHRDVKPGNLFLPGGDLGRVTLLDFGIARSGPSAAAAAQRITRRSGALIGTPAYMAPEQARGERTVDARADVFALGCVLFECLTGRPVYLAEHVMAVLAKVLFEEAPRASDLRDEVPAALDALLARMLDKAPAARPPDGAAVARELEALELAGATPPADPLDAAAALTSTAALTAAEQRLVSVVLVASSDAARARRAAAAAAAGSSDALGTQPTMLSDHDEHAVLAPLRAAVAPFGARLELFADGAVVATLTTAAGAATDQATLAARCALALRDARPGSAVALATGRAVVAARWPVGEAIDRAADLLFAPPRRPTTPPAALRDLSPPPSSGTPSLPPPEGLSPAAAQPVRLDEVTAGLLDGRFDLDGDARGLVLRGLRAQPVEMRTLLGRATPCVGREVELGLLRGVFDECAGERVARAVLITGPAGVGKSRLCHEFVAALRRAEGDADGDATAASAPEIWVARGDPMRAGAPFALLARALRSAAGVLDADAPAVARRKLRARATRRLGAGSAARASAFLAELAGVPYGEADPALGPDVRLALRAARADPALMGDQLRRAWEELLAAECRARPVLLVVEDLHWGDWSTVRLLDDALRALAEQPLMVLALARPEVHATFTALWRERAVTEVVLGALSRRASEKLVRAALGDGSGGSADVRAPDGATVDPAVIARVVAQAGGNAFYLEELIRAVAAAGHAGDDAPLPGTVLAMAQARLAALPPDARRALRAASVLGQAFRPRTVGALLGIDAGSPGALAALRAQLDVLVEAEVLVAPSEEHAGREDEYAFRHALVREAAYGMLTEPDRVLGHRLAGDWLEAAAARDRAAVEPNVLAEHLALGGEPRRAARWFARAATQAVEGNDFAAAVALVERGVACLREASAPSSPAASASKPSAGEAAPDPALGALRLVEAEAHRWRGEIAAAAAASAEAMAHLPRGEDAWCTAAGELAIATGRLGDAPRLVALADELAALADAAGDALGAPLGNACVRAAAYLVFEGESARVEALLARVAACAPRFAASDPVVLARHSQVSALRAMYGGDHEAAIAHASRAVGRFEAVGDKRNAGAMRGDVACALMEVGAFAAAEAELRAGLATAEALGLSHAAATAQHNLGRALAARRAYGEAAAVERAALARFVAQGDRRMECACRIYLAAILHDAGALDDAVREARAATEVPGTQALRTQALATLAQAELARGELAAARASAEAAAALLAELGGLPEGEALVGLVHAEVLWASGAHDAARAAIGEARARLEARAARIADPSRRATFLSAVPEHARILARATAWLAPTGS